MRYKRNQHIYPKASIHYEYNANEYNELNEQSFVENHGKLPRGKTLKQLYEYYKENTYVIEEWEELLKHAAKKVGPSHVDEYYFKYRIINTKSRKNNKTTHKHYAIRQYGNTYHIHQLKRKRLCAHDGKQDAKLVKKDEEWRRDIHNKWKGDFMPFAFRYKQTMEQCENEPTEELRKKCWNEEIIEGDSIIKDIQKLNKHMERICAKDQSTHTSREDIVGMCNPRNYKGVYKKCALEEDITLGKERTKEWLKQYHDHYFKNSHAMLPNAMSWAFHGKQREPKWTREQVWKTQNCTKCTYQLKYYNDHEQILKYPTLHWKNTTLIKVPSNLTYMDGMKSLAIPHRGSKPQHFQIYAYPYNLLRRDIIKENWPTWYLKQQKLKPDLTIPVNIYFTPKEISLFDTDRWYPNIGVIDGMYWPKNWGKYGQYRRPICNHLTCEEKCSCINLYTKDKDASLYIETDVLKDRSQDDIETKYSKYLLKYPNETKYEIYYSWYTCGKFAPEITSELYQLFPEKKLDEILNIKDEIMKSKCPTTGMLRKIGEGKWTNTQIWYKTWFFDRKRQRRVAGLWNGKRKLYCLRSNNNQ